MAHHILLNNKKKKVRCAWTGDDPLMITYHDTEWGVPVHNDTLLFEFLVLEGAQAGLNWKTILHKREGYMKAFNNFDPLKISRYTPKKIDALVHDSSIIRNRLKIRSAVENAKQVIRIQKEYGLFSKYIWSFVNTAPHTNARHSLKDIPSSNNESDVMSKALKKEGFSFVGTTICYAFMQAVGMMNDHTTDCFRYNEIKKMK